MLPVNYTPAEMTLHATLIVGLSQMLVELHVALIIFRSVGLDLLAPGCSMSSTPRYTADPLAAAIHVDIWLVDFKDLRAPLQTAGFL